MFRFLKKFQADICLIQETYGSKDKENIWARISEENPRGPGFWKFNNELLEIDGFVKELVEHMENIKKQFIHMEETNYWDLIKFEIGHFSRRWAKNRAKTDKENKFKLYTKMSTMQKEYILDEVPDPELARNMT